MRRFWPVLLLGMLAMLGTPGSAFAADPEVEPFVEAAAVVTTECDEYEPDHFLCSDQDAVRYVFTSVTDFGTSFQVQSGRNRFDAASPIPAEPDLMAHWSSLVELALGEDPAAQAWLTQMNTGPQASGQLVRGSWTLTWQAAMLELTDPPVANVSLDLFYFPSASPSPLPATGPDLGSYLDAYGFACADASDGATECTLEIPGDAGTDATYSVLTHHDAGGEVIGIDARAESFDESMPSDAASFLRGVVERAPLDDTTGFVAWFDAALSGGTSEYSEEAWTASWSDVVEGAGRTWALTLAAAGVAPEPTPATPAPTAPAPTEPTDGGSSFAEAVPTPAEISTDPVVLLQSAALAALVVFLMPFPSQLFNSTLEANEDEVKRWLRLDRLGAVAGGVGAFWATWPGVVLFTLLAALLFSFLDPGFGLDIGSLTTFVGMLLGIVLVTAAFAVPAVLAHRRIGDRPSLKVVPISLAIGVACVLLSRLTGFQPGYLYGLLIGLVFARELSAADEGRATALGAVLMLGVAFVSWLALGALPDRDGFGLVLLQMTLAAFMVAGLEGVVFGLLPMRFLPGEPLYAWNRLLWGALLAIGAFAFFHILINPASGYLSDTSRTPLLTVVALLIGFSLVSVAFWAWFRFRSEPPAEEAVA